MTDEYQKFHEEISLPCVRVRAEKVGGSGTVIYSAADDNSEFSTYVLTNHHVVDDLIKVEDKWDPILQREVKRDTRGIPEVHFFTYRWKSRATGAAAVEADIVAYDKDKDLALLHLRSGQKVPAVAKLLPRGAEIDLRVGMPVICCGACLGEPPIPTQGMLAQFGREIDREEFWLSTAPSIFGNSGGALFLAATHEFIGVPARVAVYALGFGTSAVTHLSYAIPITRVYGFFEAQMFRFIYDPAFTEPSEEKARKDALDADRKRTKAEEAK